MEAGFISSMKERKVYVLFRTGFCRFEWLTLTAAEWAGQGGE